MCFVQHLTSRRATFCHNHTTRYHLTHAVFREINSQKRKKKENMQSVYYDRGNPGLLTLEFGDSVQVRLTTAGQKAWSETTVKRECDQHWSFKVQMESGHAVEKKIMLTCGKNMPTEQESIFDMPISKNTDHYNAVPDRNASFETPTLPSQEYYTTCHGRTAKAPEY